MPAVISRLSKSYPRLNFHVDELSVRALQYRALRERNVEFVVTRLPQVPDPDVNIEVLFDDPIFVAVGANSPWARRRRIQLAELIDEPWTHPPYTAIVGPVLIEAFRAQGLEPPQGVSCLNMQMHKALLATGRYVAALPSSLLRFSPEQLSLKRLPIELPQVSAPVGISFSNVPVKSQSNQRTSEPSKGYCTRQYAFCWTCSRGDYARDVDSGVIGRGKPDLLQKSKQASACAAECKVPRGPRVT